MTVQPSRFLACEGNATNFFCLIKETKLHLVQLHQ